MKGRFTADGSPVWDGEVALFAPDFVALAVTGADGGFTLDGGASGPATLVGRARDATLGIARRPVAADDDSADIEAPGPWHELVLEVRPPDGDQHPRRLSAFMDPDVSPREHAVQTADGAERSHFATVELPQPQTRLRVQQGTWRVAASFIVYERPMIVTPDFKNYVTARACVDGSALPGDAYSGFELEVDSPVVVVLELRELANHEL